MTISGPKDGLLKRRRAACVAVKEEPQGVPKQTHAGFWFLDVPTAARKRSLFANWATFWGDSPLACTSSGWASHCVTNTFAMFVSSGLHAHKSNKEVAVGCNWEPQASHKASTFRKSFVGLKEEEFSKLATASQCLEE